MGTQQEVIESCDLLKEDGTLNQIGYATQPLWQYDRRKIKAAWHRIKEWDYYAVLSQELGYGITFTVSDLSYIGLVAVCWLDFKKGTSVQLDTLTILPKGKTNLPPSSESGTSLFKDKKINLQINVADGERILEFDVPGFTDTNGDKGLKGKITLRQDPKMDSMAIATSWEENRRAFYYNHKVNCMPAIGNVTIGEKHYPFQPDNSFGVLDWGRGNWTYKNQWYWGSASGLLDGIPIGWNIGYGFSDRSPATENMLFYNGRAHKLDEVTFHFNSNDFMQPWQFTSNDNRFEMTMTPIVDRNSAINLGLIKSAQHQVFGLFSGHLILDNGTKLSIENMLGFAEDVLNWW